MFPIGGMGFRASAGISINLNMGGGAPSPLGGGCGCGGGMSDGVFPTSELSQGFGGGFSPFGGFDGYAAALGGGMGGFDGYAAAMGGGLGGFDGYAAAMSAGSGIPDFSGHLAAGHPWAGGGFDDMSTPAALLMGGGGLPPMGGFGGGLGAFGGGSLADQAMLMQAAASDANQASLIGAQTGAFGGLAGAQGMQLAGINPLMSGLAANYL